MEFYRADYPTFRSGLVVRYFAIGDWANNQPQISAGRDGVIIQGVWPFLTTSAGIESVASVLRRAYAQHTALKAGQNPRALPYDDDPDNVVEYRKPSPASSEYEVLATKGE